MMKKWKLASVSLDFRYDINILIYLIYNAELC